MKWNSIPSFTLYFLQQATMWYEREQFESFFEDNLFPLQLCSKMQYILILRMNLSIWKKAPWKKPCIPGRKIRCVEAETNSLFRAKLLSSTFCAVIPSVSLTSKYLQKEMNFFLPISKKKSGKYSRNLQEMTKMKRLDKTGSEKTRAPAGRTAKTVQPPQPHHF